MADQQTSTNYHYIFIRFHIRKKIILVCSNNMKYSEQNLSDGFVLNYLYYDYYLFMLFVQFKDNYHRLDRMKKNI